MKTLLAAVSIALVVSQSAAGNDYSIETAQTIVSSILKYEFKDAQVDQLRDSIQKSREEGATLLTAQLIIEGDGPSKRFVLFSTESGHMKQPADPSKVKVEDPFLHFTFPHFGSEVQVTSGRATFRFRRHGNSVTLVSSAPRKEQESEQGGADQPATAPESKLEGDEKPKPESKVRPQ